ncbi:hypothetical protein [Pilimelia columellifera]|uniref:Uncharacterized protein n=1 Tax=Pilimelia columellifera subsp. columellifera TaxID=706583 RepID=A0ABN3NIA7_9ACTN
MSVAAVTRELLVRCLDLWLAEAVHGARRGTVALCFDERSAKPAAVVAATVETMTEFADRLGRRSLTLVVVAPAAVPGPDPATLPAQVAVHALAGPVATMLPAALVAAKAAGAPVFLFADAAPTPPLTALGPARSADALLVGPAAGWAECRDSLRGHGWLSCGVGLVGEAEERLLAFGTGAGKRLAAFKDELWAVDADTGVRYRDPADPHGDPIAISLTPRPGPLRRELLARLTVTGGGTVTELRDFALAETIYRAVDVTHELTHLVGAGQVAREPAHGRLAGDVQVTPMAPGR